MEIAVETKVKTSDRLEKLGFKKAAHALREMTLRKRKLMLAYEHYRYVRQDKIDAFNAKLKKETIKGKEPYSATWKCLSFTPVEQYEATPPAPVLDALELAMERQCFDAFEIAHIADVKDPILFGRINHCPDRFYLAQWDDDVSIDDLLKSNEG